MSDAPYDPADIMRGLYGDGIIGLAGGFSADFADRMREDIETLFEEASRVPGGALPRGPHRFYVEVQPERVRGFVGIVTHPWFVAVCEAVLGPDYRIVEVGFDIPFPGAADQPWHRDFAVPEATTKGRRLNSLAFNLTAVDTRPEHGPLEIAPGTQWDRFDGCPKGMFPPADLWPLYRTGVPSCPGAAIFRRGRRSPSIAAPPTGRTRRARCSWSASTPPTRPMPRITISRSRGAMPERCPPG